MAALTLGDLKSLTRELVADLGIQDYDEAMLVDALNWAQEEVARKTGATYEEVEFQICGPSASIFDAGTADIPASLPGGCILIERVMYVDGAV